MQRCADGVEMKLSHIGIIIILSLLFVCAPTCCGPPAPITTEKAPGMQLAEKTDNAAAM